MNTKQIKKLETAGREILDGWLDSGSEPEDLDFDYGFTAPGDAELIKARAVALGLDPEDSEVWEAVRAGYRKALMAAI
jgi:hypothetical protein